MTNSYFNLYKLDSDYSNFPSMKNGTMLMVDLEDEFYGTSEWYVCDKEIRMVLGAGTATFHADFRQVYDFYLRVIS